MTFSDPFFTNASFDNVQIKDVAVSFNSSNTFKIKD